MWNTLQKKYSHLSFDGGNTMKNKIAGTVAAGIAALLIPAVSVQAVTVNFGTAATVSSDSIQGWPKGPDTVSETAVLIDADTGAVLYDKGKDEYRYPASTTKIMTVLTAIENSSPEDSVTFTETGVRDVTWDSSNIGMQLGETITMKDCWYAAIIKSANEVCAQMAEYVGGTEAQFIEMMNEKARELRCRNTHFANASGLPDSNHYTTAYDLAKIMRAGLQNPRFRKVISAANYTIPATNLSEARGMHTHMPLMAKESNLYYEGCIGGKTGNTNDAGHTLVVAAERNGRTYIAVTMRTADLGANCTDSIALFDYAFDNFDTLTVNGKKMTVPKGVTADQLTVEQVDKNGTMLNRYFYNGQYVGYAAPAATPTPQAVQTAAAGTGENTSGTQTVQEEAEIPESETEEGLSDMSKILLGLMAVMAVTLVALMTALYFKVLIISTPRDLPVFEELLGDGKQLGMRFEYAVQEQPRGLADAFIIGADFIGDDAVALVLGDNIFYGQSFSRVLQNAYKRTEEEKGATIFGYYVRDPREYGVVEFDENGKALSIEEKPEHPKSNYAVPGLYFYDNDVVEIAKNVKPSARGEIEITSINNEYLNRGTLKVETLGRGFAWLDTGNHDSLLDAADFVSAFQKRQGLYISCIEEIAYKRGFINKEQLVELAQPLLKTAYGKYLIEVAEGL